MYNDFTFDRLYDKISIMDSDMRKHVVSSLQMAGVFVATVAAAVGLIVVLANIEDKADEDLCGVPVEDGVASMHYETEQAFFEDFNNSDSVLRCVYDNAPAGSSIGLYKTDDGFELLAVYPGADFDYKGYQSIW